ncbi:MAG: EAL domain-containing protein [Roseitalea porphyridii]|uniref:bifunctional diguanylate cyclase/phosphodiesterase n=1 Tax=Roseitalea porphyridii TaxID=1852022 RepID=UPI0032D90D84
MPSSTGTNPDRPDLSRFRARFHFGHLAAAIALAVTLAAGLFAEHQNRKLHEQSVRAEVNEQLGLVRARLEGNINGNLQLARGLVAVISTRPDIDQKQFASVAREMVGSHSQIRNLAAAPDLVIELMYPIEGNEQAIGLDYRQHQDQRHDVMRAVQSGEIVLAGPVDLVQGGRAFIGRFPVFTEDEGGEETFWGLVSAVVDVEELFTDSGLYADDLPVDIAIAGVDPQDRRHSVFFGSGAVFADNPVVATIALPSVTWQVAAIPRGGWPAGPPNAWQVRIVVLIAGLLLVVPIFVAGRLYDERRSHVAELKRSQEQLQRLSHRLELALDASRIGVWELNLDTGALTWDDRMKELYGIAAEEEAASYEVWSNALHPDDRAQAEEEFDSAIASNGAYKSEFRVALKDGTIRWIRAIGAVHTNIDRYRYIMGVNWDVSSDVELRKHLLAAKESAEQRNHLLEDARSQMEHNALHDSLTGLPNRRYLDEWLSDRAADEALALFHVDLDRFKQINDTLGHAAGDEVLKHAASVLKANAQPGDFVARIGGDEFVVAVSGEADEAPLTALAGRIIEQMRRPLPFEDTHCRCGVSIGIAVADRQAAHRTDFAKRLLIDADIALYRAKRNGRDRYEFFSDELRAEIVRTKRLSDAILSGLENGEFLPFFQPQFDAATLNIVGVEALARWEHPDDGLLAPAAFLSIAEELNVAKLIDRTILEQALFQCTRWKAAGIDIPKVSVNVSASRLRDADLIESLSGLPIRPGSVSFELLESIFLDESDDGIARNAEHLRSMGVDLEIDDFGTGYASISSLIHLRPTRLKIDRGLVTPMVESSRERQLVAAIIGIGHSLGIETVAEGVETFEHAALLRDLGCNALQGFALAAPMRSCDLIDFVRRESWRQAA